MSTPNIDFHSFKPVAATIPEATTKLTLADRWGTIKVRLAINRSSYSVQPGLYKVGNPDKTSDVFVTSNYKLTFDLVRQQLHGLNAYLLVLDTKGVNVWCAAGKGTFGTAELVKRVELSGLAAFVNHRKLIVPQLGAPGIAAHLVKKQCGFNVVFGPVRATDIKAFIANNYQSTKEMRKVQFTLSDRLKLIPVEVILNFKYLLMLLIPIIALGGFSKDGFSMANLLSQGFDATILLTIGYLIGTVITPILLPYIPIKNFSGKGALAATIILSATMALSLVHQGICLNIGYGLLGITVSSFGAMNFTGTSNYTSLSGVLKEMKIAVPLQITTLIIGVILIVIGKFI
jgi:hypothetical protein